MATPKKSKPAAKPAAKRLTNIAIIGTGGMANVHADQFSKQTSCRIIAACDVDAVRVQAFADKFQIPHAFTELEQVLALPDLDAVSIVTPDAHHAAISLACLKAGKHVLCEKPLALNYKDAKAMVAAAQKAGVINMVNLSYRNWPAIQAVAKLASTGKIGDLRHVEASYLQAWLVSKSWGDWRTLPAWLWRLSTAHGSNGVLGDVGVHIIDFACFPAGPIKKVYCDLKAFSKVEGDRIGDYVLDANDSAILNVTFENGALGTIHTTRWCAAHPNRLYLKLSGTKGTIEIDSDRATNAYRICAGKDLHTNTWKEVQVRPTPTNYQRFIRSIQSGIQDTPSFEDGANAQKVIDACFKSAKESKAVNL